MNKAVIALLLGIFMTGDAYAAGVYIDQAGSSSTTTRCNVGYQLSVVVDSSGVITAILCAQP